MKRFLWVVLLALLAMPVVVLAQTEPDMELNKNLLITWCVWAITSGGAGTLASGAFAWVERRWKALANLDPDIKLLIVYIVTVIFGVGAWVLLLWLGFMPIPTTPQDWVLYIAAVIGAVFASSQLVYRWSKVRRV